jgi:carboxyl-terminal processing protease
MSDSRRFQTRVRWISAVLTILVLATGTVGVWRRCSAELREPTSRERYVTQIVAQLLEDQHLSRQKLDDEISKRAFKLFLDGLDPHKLYFYQSDIDEFRKHENDLDDMVGQGNTRFAHWVFKRFMDRAQERVALVDELLQGTLDFTIDEELITDPDLLQYPRDAAEARERWRKRIKYDLLVIKAGNASKPEAQQEDPEAAAREARETVSRRYQNFARRMGQFDNDDLLELFLGAVTSAFDPHTSYMSPSSLENFRIAFRLKLEGIGAQLQDRDGKTIVAKIVPGGAADKHGKLKKEDQIVSVGRGRAPRKWKISWA